MPHHKDMSGGASSGFARASKQAGKRPHGNARPRLSTGQPDIRSMQQAYGNQAVERMVHAVRAKLAAEAADALKEPYAAMASRMEAAALREGRADLLESFAALEPPQRMAVLRSSGMEAGGADHAPESIDWQRLAAGIRSVQGVSLEEREVDAEATVGQPGTETAAGAAADLSGLLAPYREIARWLHYKADKQGKDDQMRLFHTLSIPQMKIALHKMAGRRQLDMGAFAEAMTVTIELKEWVDWGAFASAVRAAEQIKVEDAAADPLEYVAFEGETGSGRESEEDGGLDIGGVLVAAGLLGFGADREEDFGGTSRQDGPAAGNAAVLRARLSASGQLGWLLLGSASGMDGPAAVAAFLKKRPASDAVVDRFLGVPADSNGRARVEMRGKLLRQQGFGSVEQCHAELLRELAGLIVERGANNADPAYAKLLGDMGLLPENGSSPKLDAVLNKLIAPG